MLKLPCEMFRNGNKDGQKKTAFNEGQYHELISRNFLPLEEVSEAPKKRGRKAKSESQTDDDLEIVEDELED